MAASSSWLAEGIESGWRPGARSVASRDPKRRRKYAPDPWGYFRDVLGADLTPQQDEILEAVIEGDRVGIPAANNLGKTFILGGLGVFLMDAVAAQEGEHDEEMGARLLLPGPNLSTIRATIWGEVRSHARRAEQRGYLMPGVRFQGRSDSTLWRVREGWEAEAMSPPKRPGEKQAHGAAGRHAENQWAIIEEGAGVPIALWNSAIGMCSGYGNKIIAAWNPTERAGFVYELTRKGSRWKVITLSAMDHPNVLERRPVIPAAISHHDFDDAVETECDGLGPYPETLPDPDRQDFVYALPPRPAPEEDAPRADGFPGHRDGVLHVYRPRGLFAPRRLGLYPVDEAGGLFDPVAWDRAVARWLASQDPTAPPDRVGVDAAGGGRDDICAAPSWGQDQDTLLSLHAEALQDRDLKRLAAMQATERIRIGRILALPSGRGPAIASHLEELYPRSYWQVEDIGDGKSVLDHGRDVLRHEQLSAINVTGSPPPGHPLHDEQICGNFRASMFVRFAMLVNRDLVDVPDDPKLREEVMAMELRYDRLQKVDGERRLVAYLIPKKWLKHRLGRSPDRADAAVLSLTREDLDREEEALFF